MGECARITEPQVTLASFSSASEHPYLWSPVTCLGTPRGQGPMALCTCVHQVCPHSLNTHPGQADPIPHSHFTGGRQKFEGCVSGGGTNSQLSMAGT